MPSTNRSEAILRDISDDAAALLDDAEHLAICIHDGAQGGQAFEPQAFLEALRDGAAAIRALRIIGGAGS